MLLILPLPFTWRKKMFRFISESALVAKLQYGMKITFIFILILFVDSVCLTLPPAPQAPVLYVECSTNSFSQVNRVYRVTQELSASPRGGQAAATMGPERMEVQARKFYSQRNMYLCGFTLFLSLILNRTYALILDVLRLEEAVSGLRKESNANGGDAAGAELLKLKKELEAKDRDLEVVKKQAEGLAREYGELSDRYGAVDGSRGEVRKDL